jgi:hypothetical protein
MGFTVSEYIVPMRGGGDGGDGHDHLPIPLPVTVYPSVGTFDPNDPRPVVIYTAVVPENYRAAKLIYIVFRNGIEQVPGMNFNLDPTGTLFVFVQPFNQDEYLRLYAYGFSL